MSLESGRTAEGSEAVGEKMSIEGGPGVSGGTFAGSVVPTKSTGFMALMCFFGGLPPCRLGPTTFSARLSFGSRILSLDETRLCFAGDFGSKLTLSEEHH